MKKKLVMSSLLLTMVSTTVQAQPPSPTGEFKLLVQDVVKSFLQTANDLKSPIHQKLAQFNQENTDGRNPQGLFPTILTENNIKVILISGEDIYGRYCSQITEKPEHLRCENEISADYVIVLPYKIEVHKATEYQSLLFTTTVVKTSQWNLDEKEREYDRHDSIKITPPLETSIKIAGEK